MVAKPFVTGPRSVGGLGDRVDPLPQSVIQPISELLTIGRHGQPGGLLTLLLQLGGVLAQGLDHFGPTTHVAASGEEGGVHRHHQEDRPIAESWVDDALDGHCGKGAGEAGPPPPTEHPPAHEGREEDRRQRRPTAGEVPEEQAVHRCGSGEREADRRRGSRREGDRQGHRRGRDTSGDGGVVVDDDQPEHVRRENRGEDVTEDCRLPTAHRRRTSGVWCRDLGGHGRPDAWRDTSHSLPGRNQWASSCGARRAWMLRRAQPTARATSTARPTKIAIAPASGGLPLPVPG